nr:MAG TPA: hypothetical protein [Caudoviricetes sp.]
MITLLLRLFNTKNIYSSAAIISISHLPDG